MYIVENFFWKIYNPLPHKGVHDCDGPHKDGPYNRRAI